MLYWFLLTKNVTYIVKPKPESLEEFVYSLAAVLKNLRVEFPQLLIFCRKYDEYLTMYRMLRLYIGKNFTESPGSSHLAKYKLVDMYTK